jgi:glycogen debranching enzyme
VRDLDRVLSPEGWTYASAPPQAPDDPGRFHALFGRDSLIVALQLVRVLPEVARATLRALAALQGTRDDPETVEEPGKILHEHRPRAPERFLEMGWPVRDGELRYFGSADSTSWFLVVLATLDDPDLSRELEPAWRAAGAWLERALEQGGGFVRHGPVHGAGGLAQQGWRDSIDPLAEDGHGGGILRPDGGLPDPPLADADSQAVALAALRALARLSGEDAHRRSGDALSRRISERFGPEIMALDAHDRPVFGAGSQLGWLLWAGAELPGAAERLCQPDVMTPWGLRTLSSDDPRYDPFAYHRGGVWPFDCWIGWGGLLAAGREDEAERMRFGVLEAIDRLGPQELYAVTEGGPERIPIANRVQAWTVGARWALENAWDGRELVG